MEIEVEYNEKKLSHTDLTQLERLSIEAEFYEARLKQKEAVDKRTIEEAFQKAKLALQKQYNIETADENMNVLQAILFDVSANILHTMENFDMVALQAYNACD